MMKHYSAEFREQAVGEARENGNVSATARKLGISASTLRRWLKGLSPASEPQSEKNAVDNSKPKLTEQSGDLRLGHIASRYAILLLVFAILSAFTWVGLFAI